MAEAENIIERCECPGSGCTRKLLFKRVGSRLLVHCSRCDRDYFVENVSVTGPVTFRTPRFEDYAINKRVP